MNETIPIMINGGFRDIRRDWWDELIGPKPPKRFDNDGCTLAFDYWHGLMVWPACVIHDWHYSAQIEREVANPPSRFMSDYAFFMNTYKILRLQEVGRVRAIAHATKRLVAVRKLGKEHFRRKVRHDQGR